PKVWVCGEICDFSRPRSGHLYFTLKDETSQIRAVIWRSTAERLGFEVEDGQAVVCFGRIDLYAPRGSYQIVLDKLEPQGLGALQLAFRQLHARLEKEGLFDPARKRAIPS
ncbi:MAG: exodeoxyribonuclease VII large subunit, partial [Pirellulaceae bacterium]